MEETVKLRKQLTRTRVVVVVLIIFSAMCLVYGQIQHMEAERQTELSEQAMAEAKRQEAMAVQTRAEAERQRMLAEENAALAAANNQKKK